jgi:hypothetical protein
VHASSAALAFEQLALLVKESEAGRETGMPAGEFKLARAAATVAHRAPSAKAALDWQAESQSSVQGHGPAAGGTDTVRTHYQ